jgi:type I restriction enzyme, S subunit
MTTRRAAAAASRPVELGELIVDGPRNGYSGPTGPDATGSPTLRLSATTLGRCVLDGTTTKRLFETIDPTSELWLEPGDLLVQRSNTIHLVGTAAIYEGPPRTYVYPDLMMRLRFREPATGRFAWRYMNSPAGRAFFSRMAAGSSGSMPKVSGAKLRTMQIPLPPLEKQRRVTDILDRTDALRAKRRAALAKLCSLAESIFLDMFGDPATNPKGWDYQPLGSLASRFSDGPFGSNLKTEHYATSGVRVVRLQNIGVGVFLDDDKAFVSEKHFARLKKHECLPGDLLVGTLGDPNLRACIQPRALTRALNKADCVQIRPDERVATAPYLCALLNSAPAERMAQDLMHGQTRVRISMGRLRGLEVPVPPIDLQHRFARQIGAVEQLRASQRAALSQLDTLFASLQHHAFRGDL